MNAYTVFGGRYRSVHWPNLGEIGRETEWSAIPWNSPTIHFDTTSSHRHQSHVIFQNGYYFLPRFSPALKGQDTKFVNSNLKIIMQWRGDLWRHLTIVAKFWISSIFLDRHGHLHCRTMNEKYGLSFCSWVQLCTGKSCMSMFNFFCLICRVTFCWDPETLLPWQRDVTTSPLYFITNHSRQYISPLKLSMFAVCKLVRGRIWLKSYKLRLKIILFSSLRAQRKCVTHNWSCSLPNYQMLYLNFHARSFNTLDTFETPVYQRKVLMFCAASLIFLERRNSSRSESPCLRAIQMAWQV